MAESKYDDDQMQLDQEDEDLNFVSRLSDYLEESGFHDRMEVFLQDNCHIIDTTTEEHSHEYWDLFRQYEQRVEDILGEFMKSEQVPDKSVLYKRCRGAMEKFDYAHLYMTEMLKMAEYEGFMELLRETWEELKELHNLGNETQPSESKNSKK